MLYPIHNLFVDLVLAKFDPFWSVEAMRKVPLGARLKPKGLWESSQRRSWDELKAVPALDSILRHRHSNDLLLFSDHLLWRTAHVHELLVPEVRVEARCIVEDDGRVCEVVALVESAASRLDFPWVDRP